MLASASVGHAAGESWLHDTNGDQIVDTVMIGRCGDMSPTSSASTAIRTENGIDDYSPWEFSSGGVSVVGGPVTNPDWFYSLMMDIAVRVGPTFGAPDSDHDGYHDNIDAHPGDPFRA